MMDYVSALRALNEQEPVPVVHEPMTERYVRAAAKLPLLLRGGILLGTHVRSPLEVELALFTPNGQGPSRVGCYSCFRVTLSLDRCSIVYAELWAFYDGKDQEPGKPLVRTLAKARAEAKKQGFILVGESNEFSSA